jgi:hypothetical protein
MKKCNISLKENIPSLQDYQASEFSDIYDMKPGIAN